MPPPSLRRHVVFLQDDFVFVKKKMGTMCDGPQELMIEERNWGDTEESMHCEENP